MSPESPRNGSGTTFLVDWSMSRDGWWYVHYIYIISWHLDILDSEGGFPSWVHLWNSDEKNQHFLLHWKFSLFSTQQKCVRNNRNKTSRLSTLFCTQNHQNSFTSLRERVDWRCCASSKKVPKLKTVMYERIMHAWGAYQTIYIHTWLKYEFSVLGLFWN